LEAAGYRAHGTEPFWSLQIKAGTIRFERAGFEGISATGVVARSTINGWRYSSDAIYADVTSSPCSDGMSDWIYKNRVTVMVGEIEYSGCGGGIMPPDSLENTDWRVSSINGSNIAVEPAAMLHFKGGRLSGSLGCNQLGASYDYENRQLSVGPIMSTKMACPHRIALQETSFVRILSGQFSTMFADDGSMALTAADNEKIILKRSI
jgi:heat shock protein HslJ